MKVVKHLVGWISKGVKTYYVTGNHDEMLRKFIGLKMGSVSIVNKIILDLPENKKAWIFHGDVFDVTMQHSKWLAKLGAAGYDTLILINRLANFISERIFKQGKLSLSQKIKNSVKSAVKFINNFEQTSADIGISNKYDYVICGHIHHPENRVISNEYGSIVYLNSGDWVENLSTLEFANGKWSIYKFTNEDRLNMIIDAEKDLDTDLNNRQLFGSLIDEFNQMRL
jgi:UDP-2,3-diacylglucosamine pyrophosphatase LpxH